MSKVKGQEIRKYLTLFLFSKKELLYFEIYCLFYIFLDFTVKIIAITYRRQAVSPGVRCLNQNGSQNQRPKDLHPWARLAALPFKTGRPRLLGTA